MSKHSCFSRLSHNVFIFVIRQHIFGRICVYGCVRMCVGVLEHIYVCGNDIDFYVNRFWSTMLFSGWKWLISFILIVFINMFCVIPKLSKQTDTRPLFFRHKLARLLFFRHKCHISMTHKRCVQNNKWRHVNEKQWLTV